MIMLCYFKMIWDKDRERERACVCLCVKEREWERENATVTVHKKYTSLIFPLLNATDMGRCHNATLNKSNYFTPLSFSSFILSLSDGLIKQNNSSNWVWSEWLYKCHIDLKFWTKINTLHFFERDRKEKK